MEEELVSWSIEDRDGADRFRPYDYFEEDICDDASTSFSPNSTSPSLEPLLKYEMASACNIRKADVTEIGINRVGADERDVQLSHYPDIQRIRDNYDKKDVQRTTAFKATATVSPSAMDPEQGNLSSAALGDANLVFAIRGNEPVDQYNYIRIKPRSRNNTNTACTC